MSRFSQRSRDNLQGVHSDLIIVASTAILISAVDFVVIEGMRTKERQEKLVAKGASWTLDSMHMVQDDGYAHAIDVAAYVGGVRWEWPLYEKIADAFFKSAKYHRIDIQWGGNWKQRDGPHFQLPRRKTFEV